MARLVLGACVTDSEGLYGKLHHTVTTPKRKECRVGLECLALEEGLETSSATLWSATWDQFYRRHRDGTFCFLNGQRWKVILDTRFVSPKNRGAAGTSTLQTPSEEDLNVGRPFVMVLHMSASTVHVHRLNILSTPVTLHVSRVNAPTTLWLMLSFCLCGEAIATEWVSSNTSPRLFLLPTYLSLVRKREFVISLDLLYTHVNDQYW